MAQERRLAYGLTLLSSAIRNSGLYVVGDTVSRVLGLFTNFVVARAIGPSSFGIYAFGQAFVSLAATIITWGSDVAGAREAASRSPNYALLGGMRALRVYLCLVVCLAALALLLGTSVDRDYALIAVSFLPFLFITAISPEWLYHGFRRHSDAGLFRLVGGVTTATLIIFVLYVSMSVHLIALAYAVGWGFATVLVAVRGPVSPGLFERPNYLDLRSAARRGAPMVAMAALSSVHFNVGRFFLASSDDPSAVGQYSLAYLCLAIPMTGAAWASTIALPRVRASLSAEVSDWVTLRISLQRVCAIGAVLSAIVLLLGAELVPAFVGNGFSPAVDSVRVLAGSAALVWLALPAVTELIATGRDRSLVAIGGVVAVVDVLANAVLIPSMGVAGAAIATVAAEFAGFFLYQVCVRKQRATACGR